MFEIKFHCSNKMLWEYVYKVLCKKFIIANIIITLIGALITAWSFYTIDENLAVVGFTLLFLGIVEIFIVPPITAISMIKSGKQIHNGVSYETVVTFDKNIKMVEGNVSLIVEYSQIIKIYQLKYSYILMFGKKNAIILGKEGFSGINYDEFKKYIKERCNNLKN